MDLRTLPEQLSPLQRINQRRTLIERELGTDLSALAPQPNVIGTAEEKNCEQMFGVVSLPVGFAGPLSIMFSTKQKVDVSLPIATTEGALVASINRGCKAISVSGVEVTRCTEHGITRSIAFAGAKSGDVQKIMDGIRNNEPKWKAAAEATSSHLKLIGYDVDVSKQYVFLTIRCETGDAMGMNMITIAATAVAEVICALVSGVQCVTVAGNVDSDKKAGQQSSKINRLRRGCKQTVCVSYNPVRNG
jgi:hydroxymethylglutaryl-CoA reductase (NADPH)